MRGSDEGLKSEALRAALAPAMSGNAQKLEDFLTRYGGGADPRPNLRLAAALGVELAALPASPARLLERLGADDAAPDDSRVFLPMAAAHGWTALIHAEREQPRAWMAVAELAADERAPVRLATRDALTTFAHREGAALTLLRNVREWLLLEDRNKRFSATALVLEVLNERPVITSLAEHAAELLDYLTRALAEIANAPRSAERLDGRRRLLLSLPPTMSLVVATLLAGEVGPAWFEKECTAAQDPEVRGVLSDAILRLRNTSLGHSSGTAMRLRQVLEASAKPLRDPSRLRPGTGRGKVSRRMR